MHVDLLIILFVLFYMIPSCPYVRRLEVMTIIFSLLKKNTYGTFGLLYLVRDIFLPVTSRHNFFYKTTEKGVLHNLKTVIMPYISCSMVQYIL